MAVPFSNTKLRVPRGFQNLLEGLAKEVLRNQPDNIYAFAAVYFGNLLKIREEQGIDPAEIGAKHEDRFYNNKAFSKAGNIGDVSDPQQQEAATTIQAAVRGQQAREGISEEKTDQEKSVEDDAAVKIQAAYRGYEARKRVNMLKEGEQNEESRTEGNTEEIDIDLNDPEVEKAATMIQKSYRGFHVRKTLQSDQDNPPEAPEPPGEGLSEESPPEAAHPVEEKTTPDETAPSEEKAPEETAPTETTPEDKGTEEEIDIDLTDPEVEKAALKIQGGFRGLKVRKEMKEMKEKDAAGKEEDVAEAEEKTEEKVEETEKTSPAEEEIDIDLNDPEVGKAALKIQAGFRGYKDRKNLKDEEKGKLETVSSQEDQYQAGPSSQGITSVAGSKEMFSHIDASDPQVNLAASKIQAGFKGMMVRNQLLRLFDSVDSLDVKLPLSTKESLVTKPDEVQSTTVSSSSLLQGDTAMISMDSETMSTVRKILEQIVTKLEELTTADGGSVTTPEEMKREEQEWKDQTTGTEEIRKSVMKVDVERALKEKLDNIQDEEPLLGVETVKTDETFDVLVDEEGADTHEGEDHSVRQETIEEGDISKDGKQMETDVHKEKRGDTLGSQQSSFSFLKGIVSYIADKVSSVSGTEQRKESESLVKERKFEVESTETVESTVIEKAMDISQEEEFEPASNEGEVRDTRAIGIIDESEKIEGKLDTIDNNDVGDRESQVECGVFTMDNESVGERKAEIEGKTDTISFKDVGDKMSDKESKDETIDKKDVGDTESEIESKEDSINEEDLRAGILETELKEEAIDEKGVGVREAELEGKSDTVDREDVGGGTSEIEGKGDSIGKEDLRAGISETEVKDEAIDEKDAGVKEEMEGKSDTIGREDVGGGTSAIESKEDAVDKEDLTAGILETEVKDEAIDEKDAGVKAEMEGKSDTVDREDVGGETSEIESKEDSIDKKDVKPGISIVEVKGEAIDKKDARVREAEIEDKSDTIGREDVGGGTFMIERKEDFFHEEGESERISVTELKAEDIDQKSVGGTESEIEGKEATMDGGDGTSQKESNNVGITVSREVVEDGTKETESKRDTINGEDTELEKEGKEDTIDTEGVGHGESSIGRREDTIPKEVGDTEIEKEGKVDTIDKESEVDTGTEMDSKSDTIDRKDVRDDTSEIGSKENSMDKEDLGDSESKEEGKEDSSDRENVEEKESEKQDKADATGKENGGDGMSELGDKEYTIDEEIVVNSELEKVDKGDIIEKDNDVGSKSEVQGKENAFNIDIRHEESETEGKGDAMSKEDEEDGTSKTECKQDSTNKEVEGELEPDRQDKGSTVDKEDAGDRESEIDKDDYKETADEVIGTLTVGDKDNTIDEESLGDKMSEIEGKDDSTVRKDVGDEEDVAGIEVGLEGKVDTVEKEDLGARELEIEDKGDKMQYDEKGKCWYGEDAKVDVDSGGEVLTSKEEVELEIKQPAQEEKTDSKVEAGNKVEGIEVERLDEGGEEGVDADNENIVSATGDEDEALLETMTGRRAHGDEEGRDVECIHDVRKNISLDGEDTAEGKQKAEEMNGDNSVDMKDNGRKVDESETTKEGITGEEVVVCDEEKYLDKVNMKEEGANEEKDGIGDLVDNKELTNGEGKMKDAERLEDGKGLSGEGKDEMGGGSAEGDKGKNIVEAGALETKVNGEAQDNTGNEIVDGDVGGISQKIEGVSDRTEASDEQICEKSHEDTADVLEKERTDQYKEVEPVGKQNSTGIEVNSVDDEGREMHGDIQTVGLSDNRTSDLVNPEVIDIDLNDPGVQEAALKIQKGFKRRTPGRQNRNVKESKMNVSLVENKGGGGGYVQDANKDMNDRKKTTGTANQVKGIKLGLSGGPVSHTVRQQEQRNHSQEKRVFSSSISIVPGKVISSSHSKVLKKKVDSHKSINNKSEEVGEKLGGNHGESKMGGTEITQGTRVNNEEEIDIDLTDPEVEKAALKIQSSFKGKFKKKAPSKGKLPSKEMEKNVEDDIRAAGKMKEATEEEIDIDLNDPEVEKAALKIQSSFKGKFKKTTRDKTAEKEGEGNVKSISKTSQSVENQKNVKIPQEEEIDIDLNDPEVEKAALKIQSSFKGKFQKKVNRNYQNSGTSAEEGSQVYKGRIKVQGSIGSNVDESKVGYTASLGKKPKEVSQSVNNHEHLVDTGGSKVPTETEVDIDLTDPEVQRAAVRIQAGYKGFQKRKKEVKEGGADEKADGEDAGKEEHDTKEEESKGDEKKEESKPEEEEVDIDLTDPEVEQAAIKIQAGFKTMMNKKKKTKEDTAGEEEKGTSEEVTVTANDEEQPSDVPGEGEPTTEEDVPAVSEEVAADTVPAYTTGGGSPNVAEATSEGNGNAATAEVDGNAATTEGGGNDATTEGDGNAETTEADGNVAATEGGGNDATTEGDGNVETTEGAGQSDEKAAASSDEVPAEAEATPMEGTSEEKPEGDGTEEKPSDA